ncbi:MAG: hypothetical protein RLZZ381_3327 [Cyanobacteriota bacterium]
MLLMLVVEIFTAPQRQLPLIILSSDIFSSTSIKYVFTLLKIYILALFQVRFRLRNFTELKLLFESSIVIANSILSE